MILSSNIAQKGRNIANVFKRNISKKITNKANGCINKLNTYTHEDQTLEINDRVINICDNKFSNLEKNSDENFELSNKITSSKKIHHNKENDNHQYKIDEEKFGFDQNGNSNINFNKTKEIEFLYYQYVYNGFFQCVFCLSSIICAVMQYEWDYSISINDTNSESVIYIANCFCFITSICLWIVFIYEHFINCRISYLRKNLPERIWRKKYEEILSLILKLIFSFLHPNPLFIGIKINLYNEKYNTDAMQSLNSIMTVFCLLRLWCIFKFYLTYSDYYSPRSQRICQLNNFDTSMNFSMKANMTKAPQNAYLILFVFILGYCAYCLRIFERVLDDVSGKDFSSFWNSMWCVIITMTTVGYGDFYPSSFLGRTIGILSCTCGIFLISMLIVTIANLLDLSPIEENVFKIIQRIKLTKEKDNIAAKLITKYTKNRNKMKNSLIKNKNNVSDEILLDMYYLKEKVKEIDDTFPHYGENDIIQDQLAILEMSIDEVKENYESLEEQLIEIKNMLNS